MGFIQDLAKGFIRSAVNQVGRDGGKVISNRLYGDAHSTPIRHVGQSTSGTYFDTRTNEQLSPEQLRQYAITQGWQPLYSSFNWTQRIMLLAIAYTLGIFFAHATPLILLIPVPCIILLIKGFKRLNPQHTTYRTYIEIPNIIRDNRYNAGTRVDGTLRREVNMKMLSTDNDKRQHRILGILYIILAILLYAAVLFTLPHVDFNDRSESETEQLITIEK